MYLFSLLMCMSMICRNSKRRIPRKVKTLFDSASVHLELLFTMKVRLWASNLEMKSITANVELLNFAPSQQMPLPLFSQVISHNTLKQSTIWGDDDFFSLECIPKSSSQPVRHQKSISLRDLSDSSITSFVPPPHRSYSSTFRSHTKCTAGSGICTHCFYVYQLLSPISVWLPYSK